MKSYRCYAIGERTCKVIVRRKKVIYHRDWIACWCAGLCDYGAQAW